MSLAATALVISAVVTSAARAEEALTIGDPAPPIAVSEWVKGDPVETFDKDTIYVVEFWATWCGPCRTSIPHLTELQKTYKDKDVEIIGVSVYENDPTGVAPFVKEMGDKMEYRVAKDLVPEGQERDQGKMAQGWMEAAQESGIPTAFVVQGGKVIWIGHPMSLDEPLAKIVAGDYDLEAARTARREEKAREESMMALQRDLVAALRARDTDKALAVIDKAIADNPALEPALALVKFNILRQEGDSEKLAAYGTKLVEGALKDSAQGLNQLAWLLVDPRNEEIEEPIAQLALKAAQRASELTDDADPAILDTLARAYFVSGQADKAVTYQQKAIERAGDDADDAMKDRLEEYRKAAGGKE